LPYYFGIKNDGTNETIKQQAMHMYLVWSGLNINKHPYKKPIFPPLSLFLIGFILGIVLGLGFSYGWNK
jgi:hypothetical protein